MIGQLGMNKLPLKDVLAAIDMGAKEIWDELSNDEKKQVSFFLLNRYVSSQKGVRDSQELAVFKTNEYYNKNFFNIQKHKKLLWQLLCISGNTKNYSSATKWESEGNNTIQAADFLSHGVGQRPKEYF